MDSSTLRDPAKRREAMLKFPRKSKGKFEKTAARVKHGRKYRKDFKKIEKK